MFDSATAGTDIAQGFRRDVDDDLLPIRGG
jgi:hypothetical protein